MRIQPPKRNVECPYGRSGWIRRGSVGLMGSGETRAGRLRDMVGLLAAGAGIFTALLYLAGRGFASGYFSAMNIPEYKVSFSLQEYGAVSWLPLFLFPTVAIGLGSVLAGMLSRISDCMAPLFSRLRDWLHQHVVLKLRLPGLPEASRQTKNWFGIARFAYLLFLLFLMISATFYVSTWYGGWSGREYLLKSSPLVEIGSRTPQPLGTATVLSDPIAGEQYWYTGFRMLTFNGGMYYLFKDIDPATCKPGRVYAIQERESLQVNLLPARSIVEECQ